MIYEINVDKSGISLGGSTEFALLDLVGFRLDFSDKTSEFYLTIGIL